ncbi:MAG TPA: hypothetical protein VI306_22840 [Pyrinomonadaceae bacterium]
MNSNRSEPVFTIRFVEVDASRQLELANTTPDILRTVEILTVFLKREEAVGSSAQRHIRFETIDSIRSQEKVVVKHRTWEDGKPVSAAFDQLNKLETITGQICPYVLDISYQDAAGKTRFQRIPVGH